MSSSNQNKPVFKPLYQEVQQLITQKIIAGEWKPGEILPSEFQLADLLGVSQGTVRKALNALGEANVIYRRQGVGTFVSENTLKDMLFHFFHFKFNDGQERGLPTAEMIKMELINAKEDIARELELTHQDKVIKITRIRKIDNKPCINEQIYLPHCYFGELYQRDALPNSLYHFYQETLNITINKASDKIRAVIANEKDHHLIGVPVGSPLLEVSRVAITLDGKIAEYRISRVDSDKLHYLVALN